VAEDMGDLRFAQARCVVLEGQAVLFFVHAEAAQSISVGEFAEALKLLGTERRMKFVGDFEKCHEGIIPARAANAAETKIANSQQSTVYSPQKSIH